MLVTPRISECFLKCLKYLNFLKCLIFMNFLNYLKIDIFWIFLKFSEIVKILDTKVQTINVLLHSLEFQLFILNGLEMVRLSVEAQQKCKKLNIFQLCLVIFSTMITKVQIINLLTLFTYTVKISAFHLERFRNGKTWCGW